MIELAPLEERLALFAEGIVGRYFHIKPTSEFAGRSVSLAVDQSALAGDTLYLPEQLDADDPGAYRLLALQQLCHREFGTYAFAMAGALERVPGLTDTPVPTLSGRASDFERFYHQFEFPALVSRLFHLCERLRVDALMVRAYPGMSRHLARHREARLEARPPGAADDLASALDLLACRVHGAAAALLVPLDVTGQLEGALARLDALEAHPGDVYDAAAAAVAIYRHLAPLWQRADSLVTLPMEEELDEPANWMQREARLDDWQKDLAALEEHLAVDVLEGDEAEAASGENLGDGELRPEDLDLKTLQEQRDTLTRRVNMERSALRDALGTGQPQARSFRYDEWNHLERRYLPLYCRLFEERLTADHDQDLDALARIMRAYRGGVQKRLEQIKPLGYQRLYRLADGDELDFNAVIQARQDVRAGQSPDERVYSRRDRVHRDVCAAFLVDLSASTDDEVGPWERSRASEARLTRTKFAPDRDLEIAPTDDEEIAPTEEEIASTAPTRRIIDVQREAMLVMSAALEQLGDSYGVYGFSGYGHDCVEFYVAKEPTEAFSRQTLAAIAGMKPKRSTRMGPAIRHAVRKLVHSGNALKVLLIISDGFPQDCDYGPERGEHEYGVQDTARALREAQAKGVETFCVTVDRSGHDYLKRMCPEARYLVIEEIEDLPDQLTKVYQTLTS